MNNTELNLLGKAWCELLNNTAHDITGHVATLRLKNKMLRELLPNLVKAYRLATRHQLITAELNERYLANLDDISNADDQLTAITDILRLQNASSARLVTPAETLPATFIVDSLHTVLNSKAFNEQQKQRIVLDCQLNFSFNCAPVFIESLLTHWLNRVKETNDNTFIIWTSEAETHYSLQLKETGNSMDEQACMRFFEQYFAKTNATLSIGPGFCRLACLQTGGDVLYRSEPGEYTQWTILFPKREIK